MEKSPCESCGIRGRCEKNRGCKEWKELADQKDDEKFAYTRGVVDRRLKKICGEYFVPWEERYGQE